MESLYPNQEVLYEPSEEHKVKTFYIKDKIPAIFIKYTQNKEKAKIKLLDSRTLEVESSALKLRQCSDTDVYQAYIKPQHVHLFTQTSNLLGYYLRNVKGNVYIDRFYIYNTLSFNIDEFQGAKLLINDPKTVLYCLKSMPQLQKYVRDQINQNSTIRIHTKQNYIYVNQVVFQSQQLGMKVPWLPIITFQVNEKMFYDSISNNYSADKQTIVLISVQEILKNENNLIFLFNMIKNNQQSEIQKIESKPKVSNVKDAYKNQPIQEIQQFPPNSTLQYVPGSIKAQRSSGNQDLTQSKYNQIQSPKYHYQMPLSVKMQTSIMNGNFYKNMSRSQTSSKGLINKDLTSSQLNKYIENFESKQRSRMLQSEYVYDDTDDIHESVTANVQRTLIENQCLSIQTELAAYDVLRREINQYERLNSDDEDQNDELYSKPLKKNNKQIMFITQQTELEQESEPQQVSKSEINLDDLEFNSKQTKYTKRNGINKCAIATKSWFDVYDMMSQLANQEDVENHNLQLKQTKPSRWTSTTSQSQQKQQQKKQNVSTSVQKTKQQKQNIQNLKNLSKNSKTENKQETQQLNLQQNHSINESEQKPKPEINPTEISNNLNDEHPNNEEKQLPIQSTEEQLCENNNDIIKEVKESIPDDQNVIEVQIQQQTNQTVENEIVQNKEEIPTTQLMQKKQKDNKQTEQQNQVQENDQQILEIQQQQQYNPHTPNNNSKLKSESEQVEIQQPADQIPSPVKPIIDNGEEQVDNIQIQQEEKNDQQQEDKISITETEQKQSQQINESDETTALENKQINELQKETEPIQNVDQQEQNYKSQTLENNIDVPESQQIEPSCELSYKYVQPVHEDKDITTTNQTQDQLSYMYNEPSPIIKQETNQPEHLQQANQEISTTNTQNVLTSTITSPTIKELPMASAKRTFNFDNSKLNDIKIIQPQPKNNEQIHNLLNKTINTYNKVNQMLNVHEQPNTDPIETTQEILHEQIQNTNTQLKNTAPNEYSSIDTDPIINKLLSGKKQIKQQFVKKSEQQNLQQKEDVLSISQKQLQQQLEQIENSYDMTSISASQINKYEQESTAKNVQETYTQYQLSQASPRETDQTTKSQSSSKFQLSDKIHLKTIGISQLLQTEKDHVSLNLKLQKSLQKSE